MSEQPLSGVRVVDLTTVLMGPFATQILGDYGADVVKVEAPDGDPVRGIGPARHPGMGAIFLQANRNKRSLVLDLRTAEGASSRTGGAHGRLPRIARKPDVGEGRMGEVRSECTTYTAGSAGGADMGSRDGAR